MQRSTLFISRTSFSLLHELLKVLPVCTLSIFIRLNFAHLLTATIPLYHAVLNEINCVTFFADYMKVYETEIQWL
jgi:hypothetical protein